MIHEVTELIATHLASSAHGVNSLLDGITLLTGDSEPPEVMVYQEYADDWIAQDKEPPVVPSLTVFCAGDLDMSLASGDRSTILALGTSLMVGVLYASRLSLGAKARRDAAYTLRAVRRSLQRFDRLSQSNRTLRGVTLGGIDRMVEQRLAKAVGEGSLAGLVVARATVVDSDLR